MQKANDWEFDDPELPESQPSDPLETMVTRFVKQSKVKIPPIEDGAMAPKCANCHRRRRRTGPCWYCSEGVEETFDEGPVMVSRPAKSEEENVGPVRVADGIYLVRKPL